MKTDYRVRVRLKAQGKPVIVKSLCNGFYYCGLNITQSERYVVQGAFDGRPTTSKAFRGLTPQVAYRRWLKNQNTLHRMRFS